MNTPTLIPDLWCNQEIYTIPVTADHIAQGIRNNADHCALAYAITSFGNFTHARIKNRIVRVYFQPDRSLTFYADTTVTEYINAFDAGSAVLPCTLQLDTTTKRATLIYPPTEPAP